MARSGFKMKGSPMQRNFGIGGSPMLAVCAPGDTGPGCKLNSKMNKKGTVVSRFADKVSNKVKKTSQSIRELAVKNAKKRKLNKRLNEDSSGSYKTVRYL